MSVTQRIIKNTVFLISGQVFAKLVNLALVLILAYIFGVTGFGIYSFAFAYTTLFVLLIHLGINSLLVREVARNRENAEDFIATTFPVLIVMSGFLLILINLIAYISSWNAYERIVIFIFSFYAIFETICRYFIAVIRAHEKMEYEALITVGERLVLLTVTLAVWYFKLDLVSLVSGFTLTQFLRLLYVTRLVKKKFVPIRLRWDISRIFAIL
jgi:O-antigen/teichoic acid export membrane protein